jgi:F-type H+-transporting ATPase subunit gamma
VKRPQEIAQDELAMDSLVELTSIFEGIASMRISQIKNQVTSAQQFFDVLWHIYTQIRVDSNFRFGRSQSNERPIDKDLFIIITAEGGFSGDIDEKLLNFMLGHYKPEQSDIIVVGHHGAVQLTQRGVAFKKYFKLPEKDRDINVTPLVKEVQSYRATFVYYQTYLSLMVQDVKMIALNKAVQEKGKGVPGNPDEIISEETYIFEPSAFAVVDHLERSMLYIALSQVILESKLAQYASRFRAMTVSHDKATEQRVHLRWLYNQAKRASKDERTKEIINGLRSVGASS